MSDLTKLRELREYMKNDSFWGAFYKEASDEEVANAIAKAEARMAEEAKPYNDFLLKRALENQAYEELALDAIKRLKSHPELIDEATLIWARGDLSNLSIPLMEAIHLYETANPPELDKRNFEFYLGKFELQQRAKESLNSI